MVFRVIAIKPASDAGKPVRVPLSGNLESGTVDEVVRHAVTERNVPSSDRDLTTRLKEQMKGNYGFTLNGRAVEGTYRIAASDYVEKTAPDGQTKYLEADLIIAAKETQGYQ